MLVEALHTRKDEIRHPKPEIAVPLATIVLGVVLRHVCLTADQVVLLPGMTREGLQHELKAMLWSYLHQTGAPTYDRFETDARSCPKRG
jgi:hypothetical protein